jgi:hypothetical protein
LRKFEEKIPSPLLNPKLNFYVPESALKLCMKGVFVDEQKVSIYDVLEFELS